MRIYIAKDGETLRKISYLQNAPLDELILLNPLVTSPEINVSGSPIHLPPYRTTTSAQEPANLRNEWIPLTKLADMERNEYDVLIVGSGAGGGAALSRLCEQWGDNGKRIGVVEAGDLLLPTHYFNIPTMSSQRYVNYFNHVSTKISPQFRNVIAFGGRTLLWGAAAPRMPLSDLASWPIQIHEMQYYYSIAERLMKVSPFYQEGSLLTTFLLNKLQEHGYPDAALLPLAANREPTKYGQIHSNVFFSSIALFAEALNRRPFDLAVNSRAVEIITDHNQVRGLRVMTSDKKSHFIKSKIVVLSASTFETPRLLLASGIPGRAIGHYLTDNSVVAGSGTLSRSSIPEVQGVLGIFIPGREYRPYQMIIDGPLGYFAYQEYEMKPLMEQIPFQILSFGVVESRYENRVQLDPAVRDEFGVPLLNVHFSYSEKDKTIIRQMEQAVDRVYSVLKTPSAAEEGTVRFFPLEAIHDSGTCRMGYDPDTSATDPYGQIHGISGLYVADNSVLPSSGTANPTLTTVALAIRTADRIIHQLK